ncbi:hypothetical protein [Candidatus Kuenenia stuttgartiensis]|uniref:hypothetical protein n=1 Tax=Kuenenia stuttgartiensis TaxID=174633 RepID=UPI00146BFF5E|nr:hypothetical protein [Candidatus Kuenenia stuttgartiensis]
MKSVNFGKNYHKVPGERSCLLSNEHFKEKRYLRWNEGRVLSQRWRSNCRRRRAQIDLLAARLRMQRQTLKDSAYAQELDKPTRQNTYLPLKSEGGGGSR